MNQPCCSILRISKRNLSPGNPTGIGVLVIQANSQAMLLCCFDSCIDHLKKRVREIWPLQALASVNEEAFDTLTRHLCYLPAHFLLGDTVIPEPKRVEPGRDRSAHSASLLACYVSKYLRRVSVVSPRRPLLGGFFSVAFSRWLLPGNRSLAAARMAFSQISLR